MARDFTPEEAAAVRSLNRLARRWPKSLKLFSWSGSLVIMDNYMEAGHDALLASVDDGIPNDGGDP